MLFLTGCNVGYDVTDDAVLYRTWDEANGRRETFVAADPKTFRVFSENDDYARDDKQVFYRGLVIPDADPATFGIDHDNVNLGRDRNSVFSGQNRVATSDPSFRYLSPHAGPFFSGYLHGYAVDSENVYYMGSSLQVLTEADPATFELVPSPHGSTGWGRDHRDVYCGTVPIQCESPAKFRLLDVPFAKPPHFVPVMQTREDFAALYGGRYAAFLAAQPDNDWLPQIAVGVGTDGQAFYDGPCRVDEQPVAINETVAARYRELVAAGRFE